MKSTVKILAIISIVIGSLAVLSCVNTFDGGAFIGGLFFLGQGIVNLCFIKQVTEVKEDEVTDCRCGSYHNK